MRVSSRSLGAWPRALYALCALALVSVCVIYLALRSRSSVNPAMSVPNGHKIARVLGDANTNESDDSTRDQFKALVELPDWPSDNAPESWAPYVVAAQRFQESARDVQRTVIQQVMATSQSPWDANERAYRLLLLLRVVFDLPERAPASERRVYLPCHDVPQPDSDGMVSIAWPLSWTQSGPCVVSRCARTSGPPYLPLRELEHFQNNYKYRVLRPE